MKTVIFACIHNAGRSQMAAAFFNLLVDSTKATGISAGTELVNKIHPEVMIAMEALGIDLSRAKPNKLTDELARTANLLITMGCGEKCPFVPGLEVIDWQLEDPKNQPFPKVIEIRDQIKTKVLELIDSRKWSKPEDH